MPNQLSNLQIQQILELFICSDDRRIHVIAEIIGCSEEEVIKTIQNCIDNKIKFERGNYHIMHSQINQTQ